MKTKEVSSKNDSIDIELLRQRGARLAEIQAELRCGTLEEFGVLLTIDGKPTDQSTLSKMIRGLMPISKKVLLELTSKHNVSAEYILYGVEPKFNKSDGGNNNQLNSNELNEEKGDVNALNSGSKDIDSQPQNNDIPMVELLNLAQQSSDRNTRILTAIEAAQHQEAEFLLFLKTIMANIAGGRNHKN